MSADRTELGFLSATELLAAYRARELSPVEVTEDALERIERLDPELTAFVTVTSDLALDQARAAEAAYASGTADAALVGVPVSIKDVVPTRGIRTTMGSRLFADWVPDFDAPLVERLRDAGSVLLGKTNLPELGWKGDSGNLLVGPTRNPFDTDRTAGGSSGGAAAAVAAGMGPLAQGGDGAGSIRIPAAFCGVFGLKPSHGRVPYAPAGAHELLVSEGPITRTVADAALMLDVMAGADARDRLSLPAPGERYADVVTAEPRALRVAWSPDLGHAPVDPGVSEVARSAVAALEDLGWEVEAVTPPWDDPFEQLEILFTTGLAGLHADGYGPNFDGDGERAAVLLDPALLAEVRKGFAYGAADLAAVQLHRLRLCDQVRTFMEDFDLLVTPTLPVTAFAAGRDHPERVAGRETSVYGWLGFTYPFNLTGQPAATVPAGLSDGLPVGLQLVGRWRDDATVLAAAAAFERARPWLDPLRSATEALLDGASLRARP